MPRNDVSAIPGVSDLLEFLYSELGEDDYEKAFGLVAACFPDSDGEPADGPAPVPGIAGDARRRELVAADASLRRRFPGIASLKQR